MKVGASSSRADEGVAELVDAGGQAAVGLQLVGELDELELRVALALRRPGVGHDHPVADFAG